jgi:hypothetical protein
MERTAHFASDAPLDIFYFNCRIRSYRNELKSGNPATDG